MNFIIFNNKTSSKTLTTYYLARYLSSLKKKTLVINFNENSFFKILFKNKKNIILSLVQNESNIISKIGKGNNFDLFNIFLDTESLYLDRKEISSILYNLLSIFNKLYDFIIFDCQSTNSNLNKEIILLEGKIIVPLNLNFDNHLLILNNFLKNSKNKNTSINFFVSNLNRNKNKEILNFIKIKKELSNFLLRGYVSYLESNDTTLVFNKKEVEEEYKNIFKELKIV